jgi:hypothetical protein
MLKNTILWAQAADAQCQILLAKRAPVMTVASPPDSIPVTVPVQVPPAPKTLAKADVRALALSLGIPGTLIDDHRYLNGKSKPTTLGTFATMELIDKVKDHVAAGKDPSSLWAPQTTQEVPDGIGKDIPV